jgi:hypothetical protein
MMIAQNFESGRLAKRIHQELAKLILGTSYLDQGYDTFDEFHLGELRHL